MFEKVKSNVLNQFHLKFHDIFQSIFIYLFIITYSDRILHQDNFIFTVKVKYWQVPVSIYKFW